MRREDWLLAQLPMGMLEDDFFSRFVQIFQEVATTILEGVDNLEHIADPAVAPTPLVPFLGSWIGVRSIDSSLPDRLQRQIVMESSAALAWRGTRRGLEQLLRLLCEGDVEVIESGGVWREEEAPTTPARIEVRVGTPRWASTEDFVALVLDELPANLPAEIFVEGDMVWPRSREVLSA